MKIFQVTWNNKHAFKVLSTIVPAFFSLIIRNTTRITISLISAVLKFFSSTNNTALDSSASLNASKALGIEQGVIPRQKVDSISHKVITISNTGHINIIPRILFLVGIKLSNSTAVRNSAKAISALVANLEARQVKLVDKMTILLTKNESVKNSIKSTNLITTLSIKSSLCYANLHITNRVIDMFEKVYFQVTGSVLMNGSIYFSALALKKLSEIDAKTLAEIDALTLGALDISQEF